METDFIRNPGLDKAAGRCTSVDCNLFLYTFYSGSVFTYRTKVDLFSCRFFTFKTFGSQYFSETRFLTWELPWPNLNFFKTPLCVQEHPQITLKSIKANVYINFFGPKHNNTTISRNSLT